MLITLIELVTTVTWGFTKFTINKSYELIYGKLPTKEQILTKKIEDLEDHLCNIEKMLEEKKHDEQQSEEETNGVKQQQITYM